ncbi:MAG: 5'/3'-nucleotidase SurE [Pseudomonadota bacterium]
MRVLLTNDDGISAAGLVVLTEIAEEIAGGGGELWTVAPAFEQSGVGHCITFTKPLMIEELGVRRWAVQGAPADCVIAALHHIMPEPPDLILSGVNRGNNSGENALYSGTLGAAMEGALQNIPAIALSQFYGPGNARAEDPFEAARRHGARAIGATLEAGFEIGAPYPLFYNVNFPPVPAADVKGLAATPQGRRAAVTFGAQASKAPNGRPYLWPQGGDQRAATAPGSDVDLNLAGWVSLTPMRPDLTDASALDRLRAATDR